MRTSRNLGRKHAASEHGAPVSRALRAFLGFFAAPRVNIRRDYQKIRRRQRKLAAPLGSPSRATDYTVASSHGDHLIPIRVFHPKEQLRDEVLVFFHGGGWVTGGVESYTPTCSRMADLTGCTVVSVEYRLAPEHPFPAGLSDCYDVARTVMNQPHLVGTDNADNIVLVGDSSGGNLAAAVSLLRRKRGERAATRQILLYPVTHWDHRSLTSPFESVREHGEDYRLTNVEVQDYMALYVPNPAQRRDPLVAPLMAKDLSDQPSTLVLSAELDLLRDEGEAYGRALQRAGNMVRIHRVEEALHGFIALPWMARSVRDAYEQINDFLGEERKGESRHREEKP